MKLKNGLMLILAAFIWGSAFVAQSIGMDYVGPFTFNGVRCLIGAFTLLVVCLIMGIVRRKKGVPEKSAEEKKADRRYLLKAGIVCGVILFVASSLQQFGMQYTPAGKAGFITACYIIIVPLIGIFFKKKASWLVWIAVVFAVAGLYFLCMTEELTINPGDIYVMLCAFMFACHIMAIDHFSPRLDGVKLSCMQFFVVGIISLPWMFILETPRIAAIMSCIRPLLYAGVLSCAVAYTLQILGQKGVQPTIAAILMSLESCFSVLSGWLVLHDVLSVREAFGCVLMFTAVLLAQIPAPKLGRSKIKK